MATNNIFGPGTPAGGPAAPGQQYAPDISVILRALAVLLRVRARCAELTEETGSYMVGLESLGHDQMWATYNAAQAALAVSAEEAQDLMRAEAILAGARMVAGSSFPACGPVAPPLPFPDLSMYGLVFVPAEPQAPFPGSKPMM